MQITGSVFVGRNQLMVNFEARQLDGGERWEIVCKQRGNVATSFTNNPSPWPVIEKMVAEALDAAPAAPPAKYDMNRRRHTEKPPVQRRKHPKGSVPDSKFGIAALEKIERALKEAQDG